MKNNGEFDHYLGQDPKRVLEDLVQLYPKHRVCSFPDNSFITADFDLNRLNIVYNHKTNLVIEIYFG